MKLILVTRYINFIGGIETWIYNFVQKMCKKYDITLLYEKGDINQIMRLSQFINIEKIQLFNIYYCDVCIICSEETMSFSNIIAKRYIQTIHGDLTYFPGKSEALSHKSTFDGLEYIVPTRLSQNGLKCRYDKNSTIISNPMPLPRKPKKILRLLSCTRLSKEKGYERMKLLADTLKQNNIPFEWKIFTNVEHYNQNKIEYPEIIYMKPTFDLVDYIADADYGVQLSDTEGFCYFIHECLQYHTPVIATKLPVLNETNFTEGEHGYLLEFDMSNLDVNAIYNNIPECKTAISVVTESSWEKLLGPSNTPTELKLPIQVQVIKPYFDKYYQKHMVPEEDGIIEIPAWRLQELLDLHYVKQIE